MDSAVKTKKENHQQRAYLNSLTSVLDQGSRQIVGFFVSPFIVRGLGPTFYGVYQILLEVSGYTNLADAQASQVLKWTVAQKRDVANKDELRSEVTTALYMVFIILPVLLVVGGILSWYAPIITQVEEQYYGIVRIACSIIVFTIALEKVTSLFESLLRGMNLGFKGMGVRTVVITLGGALKVFVILNGYGLIGLTLVQLVLGFGTGLVFYWLVKRNIPWFGYGKTNFQKVKSYLQLSGWFIATKVSGMALYGSEKIILGYLLGPQFVTIYVLTFFTSHTMQSLIDSVISGVVPGIGSFFGKGQFDKIIISHNIINSLIWWFTFTFGVSILLFNQSFLQLWIGEGNFAGQFENLLIVFITIQYIFFFTTGNFINVTLDLKTKVYLTGIAALLSIGFAIVLIPQFQILGLCISVLAGRMILTLGYPLILKRKINDKSGFFNADQIRPLVLTCLALVFASSIQDKIQITSWIELIGFGILAGVTLASLFWFIGLSHDQKSELVNRFKTIKIFKIKD